MDMRFDDRLIPPGINDARVRWLWGAFDAVLAGIEFTPRTLLMRTSAEMTTEMLPLAVWELSLDEFMPEEGLPEHVVRRLIDRAYELHALKGTDEGVKLGLKLLTGLTPDIVHWWQKSPRGHHDTHSITVWVGEAVYGDDVILSGKVQRAALTIIDATKRWSQDTDFRLGAGWSSRVDTTNAAVGLGVDKRPLNAIRDVSLPAMRGAAASAAAIMEIDRRVIEGGRDVSLPPARTRAANAATGLVVDRRNARVARELRLSSAAGAANSAAGMQIMKLTMEAA